MADFEKFIGEALAEGIAPEDLVKKFTAEVDEMTAQQDSIAPREDILDKLHDSLLSHLETRNPTLSDVVNLLTLVTAITDENGKKWNVKEIQDFRMFVMQYMPRFVKIYSQGKKIGSIDDKIFGMDVNKSKDKRPEMRMYTNFSDDDVNRMIKNFLKIFG